MDERTVRVACAFGPASMAARVAGPPSARTSVLRKKHREDKGRAEWALMDSTGKKVLRWFGPQRPSDERVKKEESRIQFFKHQGSHVAVTRLTWGVLPSREEFDMAFDLEQPDGIYSIRNARGESDGPAVADGDYSSDELWSFLEAAVAGGDERAKNFASQVLQSLGFEWI